MALPIALGMVVLFPWVRIRLIKLFSYRIGHYAGNTELLLCAIDEKLYDNQKKYKNFFYNTPRTPLCNKQLHIMWKRVIPILPFSSIWGEVERFLKILLGKKYSQDQLKKLFEFTSGGQDRQYYLERIKNCHISFTPDENKQGQECLLKMGIPVGAKFICLLMRDSGYLSQHIPEHDWSYHNYRDVDVDNYKSTAAFLAEQGYYVIRMGKYVKQKFSINHPNVIDYANSSLYSDFMDIYLTANCYFMISTSCGLDSVAQIFRKPLLVTDFPVSELSTWYHWDYFIPKKMKNTKNSKLVSFKEIYQDHALFSDKKNMLKTWHGKNWQFVDNTPDEILAAVKEMLAKLNNNYTADFSNQLLQERFWNSFPIELPRSIKSYKNIKMQVGASFLKSYEVLF